MTNLNTSGSNHISGIGEAGYFEFDALIATEDWELVGIPLVVHE